ncbi:MAG: hypothetical protein FJW23_17350, partial [Acidimicrobiia bacterium]|nr:hypothetical protein [Acidimicrobiia bacterium]
MGLLSAAISTTDHQFKADVGRVLRASRAGVRVADSWRVGDGMTPDVIIADVRGDASGPGGASLDRLRSAYPASALVAVAATADPVRILEAMRAGANEFLDWPTAADLVAERDRSFMGALDRIAQKRQALAGDNRRVRTLAFFGAKGGVGTTTVATNVAVELARASKQPTVLVELKQFVGEAGVYLGVRPRYTLADAIDNLHRLDVPFLRELVVRHKSGLDILSGAEQPDRPSPPEAEAVEHVLRIVQSAYEHVVLDAGVVTSACAETAACHADTLYLVVTADVPCIRNTQRVVDRLT